MSQCFDMQRNDFGLRIGHQKVNHFRKRHFAFKAGGNDGGKSDAGAIGILENGGRHGA